MKAFIPLMLSLGKKKLFLKIKNMHKDILE